MGSLIDLTGRVFTRLTVLERAPTKAARTYWLCRCECGTVKSVSAHNLGHPDPKRRIFSCGCYGAERRALSLTTHGRSKSLEMRMLWQSKKRAKMCGMKFDLSVDDIIVPSHCPLLGIPLIPGKGKLTQNSPTVDRKDSTMGYLKGNVQVISYRANAIKSDASFAEFERIYFAWKAAQ